LSLTRPALTRPAILLALVLAVAAWALAAARPAAAVGPFGPNTTVVAAGCNFADVTGDSVVGSDGVVRGFVSFTGGSCGTNPQIRYFEGSGSTWTSAVSPYRGRVLGVAWDGTSTFLLHADGSNVRVTKRDATGFTGGRLLSTRGANGAVIPEGDVVASAGEWWAVWTEPVGPGGEFAQRELFQSRTLGPGDQGRARVTTNALDDLEPSLTLAPSRDGRVLMAWTRADLGRGDVSALRYAGAVPGGAWSSRAWTGPSTFAYQPDLFTYGVSVYGSYVRNGSITQAVNPPSTQVSNTWGGGFGARAAASGSLSWVAWTGLNDHVFVGQATAPGVHTTLDLTPAAGRQQLLSVSGRAGKATVVAVSFTSDRLWAATQS
jgi:hypothetical protein